MKERPILFSGPMVRALLDGKKTQTRRLVRGLPSGGHVQMMRDGGVEWCADGGFDNSVRTAKPYCIAGDRLWVRETWCDDNAFRDPTTVERTEEGAVTDVFYRADHDCRNFEECPCNPDGDGKRSAWRPSIFMPRWASRITLEVTDVRVERLQDISEDDARAEGVSTSEIPATINGKPGVVHTFGEDAHRKAFAMLWDGINAKRAPWSSNPFCWIVSFKRIEQATREA